MFLNKIIGRSGLAELAELEYLKTFKSPLFEDEGLNNKILLQAKKSQLLNQKEFNATVAKLESSNFSTLQKQRLFKDRVIENIKQKIASDVVSNELYIYLPSSSKIKRRDHVKFYGKIMTLTRILKIQSAYGCKCGFSKVEKKETEQAKTVAAISTIASLKKRQEVQTKQVFDELGRNKELISSILNKKYSPVVANVVKSEIIVPTIALYKDKEISLNLVFNLDEMPKKYYKLIDNNFFINRRGFAWLELLAIAQFALFLELSEEQETDVEILSIGGINY